MPWVLLAITVASFVYTWYMTSKVTNQAQQVQQITGPTAAEGISIPVLFGERTISNPNTCWYGGQETNINEDKSIDYKIALQMALCHGKLDSLEAIYLAEADDTNLLQNTVTSDSIVNTLNPQMESAPQGIRGAFTGRFKVRMGTVNTAGTVDDGTITADDYANSGMGLARGPRYYGLAMVESVAPCYIGKSPQIAGVAFRAKRIHTRKGGSEAQWYDAKAEIRFGRNADDVWKYTLVDGSDDTLYTSPTFDDSAWPEGYGGFGNASGGVLVWQYITDEANKYAVPPVKTQLIPADWPGLVLPGPVNTTGVTVKPGTKLWIRGDLGPLPKQDLGVKCHHDDAGFLWFNGTAVTLVPTTDPANTQLAHFNSTATIPATLVNPDGPNVVAFCVRDSYKDFSGTGNKIGTQQFIYGDIQVGLDVSNPRRTSDMNPIHIIREIYTDDIWGAGYADAAMGDSFTTAADTCYAENLGISFLWDDQKSYQSQLEDVQRYVSGYVYVDPITGKFEIKLVRADYTVDELPVFDGHNTSTVQDIERQAVGQLVNQITATYSNTPRGKQGSVTVSIGWLIDEQGGIVNNKVDYPAVSTSFTAGRLALRDLRILSAPLLSCTLGTNRDAISMRPGQAFLLNRPDLDIDNMVMRVSEIDFGDGIKNECTIKCLEDVFYFPAEPTVASNPPITIQPPTVKIAQMTDDYYTAMVVDARNKGWVETVFNGSAFGAGGGVFANWTEISPGVMERNTAGPLSAGMFDDLDPFTGVISGSGYTSGLLWFVGRSVLALSASGDLPGNGQQYQGVYVIDDLGWDPVNMAATKARMHRDPSFSTSDQFVQNMIFSVRAGTVYGGKFEQLATANVVLGTTEQAWTTLSSFTWTDALDLLKSRELGAQNVASNSYLLLSATMASGSADFSSFETLVGTPGLANIPAGPWKIFPSIAGVSGESPGSETRLGFKIFLDAAVNPRLLFEVLSEPITSNTGEAVPPIIFNGSTFALDAADRLVLIPTIHTTSTTPATLTIFYNGTNSIHVSVPRPTSTTTTPIRADESWYSVTVVDGIISGFGDHRKLRVRGTGPLVGIDTTGLVGGVQIILSFVTGMDVTVDGSPTGAAPIKNAEGLSTHADAGTASTVYLMTDDGTTAYWRVA